VAATPVDAVKINVNCFKFIAGVADEDLLKMKTSDLVEDTCKFILSIKAPFRYKYCYTSTTEGIEFGPFYQYNP
jgi:hypothetical protein